MTAKTKIGRKPPTPANQPAIILADTQDLLLLGKLVPVAAFCNATIAPPHSLSAKQFCHFYVRFGCEFTHTVYLKIIFTIDFINRIHIARRATVFIKGFLQISLSDKLGKFATDDPCTHRNNLGVIRQCSTLR